MRIEEAHWPDLANIRRRVYVVPLGSLEQHGRHLPLMTDRLIISRIAEQVEALRGERVVMLPTQWLGHSPHHRRFGCVSLDLEPYIGMIVGICRSLVEIGARKILLLNGHGGNDTPCKAALRDLKSEFEALRDLYIVYATYWNLAAEEFSSIRESGPGGMGHACEMETSIVMAERPDLVSAKDIKRGGPTPESGFRTQDMLQSQPFFLINEFDEISENGVIGMPEFATAEKGARFVQAAVNGVTRFLDEFESWTFQTTPPFSHVPE